MPYANNKDADQPAHPRSLISAFVVRCVHSIIPLVSISEISSLYLASVAAHVSLSLPMVANPEERLSHIVAQIYDKHCSSQQMTTSSWSRPSSG